jgi:hypothetical protein
MYTPTPIGMPTDATFAQAFVMMVQRRRWIRTTLFEFSAVVMMVAPLD